MPDEHRLVEILAKLEHEKWMEWAGNISPECMTGSMIERWRMGQEQYQFLPEHMKEHYRTLARRTVAAYLTWQSDNQREFFGD